MRESASTGAAVLVQRMPTAIAMSIPVARRDAAGSGDVVPVAGRWRVPDRLVLLSGAGLLVSVRDMRLHAARFPTHAAFI